MSLAAKLCWPDDRRRNRRTGGVAARTGRGGRGALHMVGGPRRRHGARVLVPRGAAVPGCADAGRLRPRARPPLAAGVLALAALAAFTVWSFLSITWADARGDAWDGANRTLLYLLVFALFAALPWKAAEASILLGAFALATAVAGAWASARPWRGATAASPSAAWRADRLRERERGAAARRVLARRPHRLSALDTGTPARSAAGHRRAAARARGAVPEPGVADRRSSCARACAGARPRAAPPVAALSAVAATTLLASPLLLEVYASAPAIDDALTRAAIALASRSRCSPQQALRRRASMRAPPARGR